MVLFADLTIFCRLWVINEWETKIKHIHSVVLNNYSSLCKFQIQFGINETSNGNRTKSYQSYNPHLLTFLSKLNEKYALYACYLSQVKNKSSQKKNNNNAPSFPVHYHFLFISKWQQPKLSIWNSDVKPEKSSDRLKKSELLKINISFLVCSQ